MSKINNTKNNILDDEIFLAHVLSKSRNYI